MGNILSSNTVYAVAYLTDLGRKYLFDPIGNSRFISDGNNGTIDAFKVVYFSMSDPDYNYEITPGIALETGDIANISGKNEDCIKGTIVDKENSLISVNGQVNGIIDISDNTAITVDIPYVLSTDDSDGIIIFDINSIPIITDNY